MKKALLLFIVLFIGTTAKGQNYQCLQSGVKHFFINSNNYLRGIRIDSVASYADSTIYFPYHTPRGPYSPTGGMPTLDPHGGSWLGKKVIQRADGTTIFDNLWKDSVIIQTQANVGDSWTFYNDSGSLYYVATVVGKDTMSLLSSLDSIKRIRINTFDSSGALPTDPLDNLTLILSKEHGFAQAFDLYTFPYHKPDSAYRPGLDFFLDLSLCDYYAVRSFAKTNIEFNLVDFISPNDWEINPWNIGDRFNSSNSCLIAASSSGTDWKSFTSEVVSKTISGSIVTYSLTGTVTGGYPVTCYFPVQVVNAGVYSFNETLYSILSPSEMPEGNSGYLIYYFPFDSSYCRKSPLYIKRPLSPNPFMLWGYGTRLTYKAEVGLVNYFSSDGDEIVGSTLTYYNINGASCGTPLSILESDQHNSPTITPNPATTILTVKATDLPYSIIIRNLFGQTIMSAQTNQSETNINVSEVPAGIYFITITDDRGNSSITKQAIVH